MYGEKDEDGFYFGEADGKQGFVPCNMVSELVTETLNGYPESENDRQEGIQLVYRLHLMCVYGM